MDAFMKNYILSKKLCIEFFIFAEAETSGYDKIFPVFVSQRQQGAESEMDAGDNIIKEIDSHMNKINKAHEIAN